ncbi:MAG: hypothetical protein Q8898_09105 [Bacillota bacterium]|nr:hypothetical protein [Bacillota bacterium]
MAHNKDIVSSLEQLLENLIKMVAKNNQNVNNLHQRVNQLEWMMRELKQRECCSLPPHDSILRQTPATRFEVTL